MVFKRILCAYDDSPSARAAVALATDLARPDAALLICHVIEHDRALTADARAASDRERELDAIRREVSPRVGVAEAWTVEDMSAWSALSTEAKRWQADLVAVGGGSHGSGVIGSTAERVVRHAHCSVLVARAEPRPMRRVLCAVDFSPPSRAAMTVAAALAAARGVELALVHAVAEPAAAASDVHRAAEERLRRWADELDAAPSRIAVAAIDGTPRDAILQYARSRKCDIIVAGSHGGSGRVLLGSVAVSLVRWADLPVLVVR